jgi:asparagine N-glycosylation enzyme membrane subunit Stt3
LRGPRFAFVIASLVIVGGALVLPSFIDLVRTGQTNLHWSRFITMSFLYEVAAVLTVTRFLDRFLDLAAERLSYLRKQASIVTPEEVSG